MWLGDVLILSLLTFYRVNSIPDSQERSSGSDCTSERIINDLEVIEQLSNGVEINYNYNETQWNFYADSGNKATAISAPGCPKSLVGTAWVHYGDPPRCYFPGYRGPCEYMETLTSPRSQASHLGICVCDWALDKEVLESLESSDDGKYGFNPKEPGWVYEFESQKCYSFDEQGPCETGHVLIKSSKSVTVRCVLDSWERCSYNRETRTCEIDKGTGSRPSTPPPPAPPRVVYDVPSNCKDDESFSSVLKRCLKKVGTGSGVG